MAKRGQFTILAIISFIVLIIVLLAFPYIGKEYGSRDVFKKEIAAREIALTINALYAYPHDINIYYEKDLSELIVEMSNDEIKVYNARFQSYNSDPTSKKYNFVPAGTYSDARLEGPKKIKFEKIGEKITIKDETKR